MNKIAIKTDDIPKLRPGPLALYVLLWKAVGEQREVKRAECYAIYKQHVATGYSDRYVHDKKVGHGVWKWVDWNNEDWQRNFECWFVYTLGSLLRRGYLRLVPAIDLSKIDAGQLLDESEAEQQPATTPCSAPSANADSTSA